MIALLLLLQTAPITPLDSVAVTPRTTVSTIGRIVAKTRASDTTWYTLRASGVTLAAFCTRTGCAALTLGEIIVARGRKLPRLGVFVLPITSFKRVDRCVGNGCRGAAP